MTEEKQNTLLEHAYDGIREYDNPLPRWWVNIFYACILFAAGYYGYYQMGPGLSPQEEYAEAEKAAPPAAASTVAPMEPTGENILAMLQDAQLMAGAKAIFKLRCMPCHGPEGQGVIGPNLTDDFWIQGKGTPMEIMTTIRDGVPAKGMVSWKSILKPKQWMQLAAYVKSLRGSNPPNPKAPQGTQIPE